MTRIIGIDPGLRATGWGVIAPDAAGVLRASASGTISPRPSRTLAERLAQIVEEVGAVLREMRPDEGAIENVFLGQGTDAAFKLGHARAAALVPFAQEGVDISDYAPAMIKKSVAGNGRADKGQIRFMVAQLLPGAEPKTEHAADALAVALCHMQMRGARARVLGDVA